MGKQIIKYKIKILLVFLVLMCFITPNINISAYEKYNFEGNSFLPSGETFAYYGNHVFAIDTNDTCVFVGGEMGDYPYSDSALKSYWKSNLTLKDTASAYGAEIRDVLVDGDYVYICGDDTDKIYQYWTSNLTKKAETSSYGGDILCLDINDTYIYCAGKSGEDARRYWKSNLTYKDNTSSYGGTVTCIAVNDEYIYLGGGTEDVVKQYWASNMTYKTETADAGDTIRALIVNDSYIYFSVNNFESIRKCSEDDLSSISAYLSYGETPKSLDFDDTYIYVGGYVNIVSQYWKSNNTEKFETVQHNSSIYAISVYGDWVYVGGVSGYINKYPLWELVPTYTGRSISSNDYNISFSNIYNVTVNESTGSPVDVNFYISEDYPIATDYEVCDKDGILRMPHERLTCYVNDTYWIFYTNSAEKYYAYSSDGINWNTGNSLRSGSGGLGGADFSIAIDGDRMHYVLMYGDHYPAPHYPKYRMGTLCSNGGISWFEDEQNISEIYVDGGDPVITVDSNGYPWVGFSNGTSSSSETLYSIIIKSSTKNGIWTTDTGFPYTVHTDDFSPILVPLTDGKVYAISMEYKYSSTSESDIYGRLWNGTGWESEELIADDYSSYFYGKCSAVGIGDEVHLLYQQYNRDKIIYMYNDSTSWQSAETLETGVDEETYPVLTKHGSELYAFTAFNNSIFMRHYNGTAWNSTPIILKYDEDFEGNVGIHSVYKQTNGFYETNDSKLGLIYFHNDGTMHYINIDIDSIDNISNCGYGVVIDDTYQSTGWVHLQTNNSVYNSSVSVNISSYLDEYEHIYYLKTTGETAFYNSSDIVDFETTPYRSSYFNITFKSDGWIQSKDNNTYYDDDYYDKYFYYTENITDGYIITQNITRLNNSWNQFYAHVNNTANSTFSLIDPSTNYVILDNLDGDGDDISSVTNETVRICCDYNTSISLFSLNISWTIDTQDESICSCSANSYDYGNWSFSEHVPNGNLEEDWCECNDTLWDTNLLIENDTEYNVINGEGDGSPDSGALTFLGDDSDNNYIKSEFEFTPNKTGEIYQLNIYVNHTMGSSYSPNIDIYIDSGETDQTIDGTLVKNNWNPSSWTVGWHNIPLDTNYSVVNGNTYEVQFNTTASDDDSNEDRLYIGYDDSPTSTHITLKIGTGSWSEYDYLGQIIFNITEEFWTYSVNGTGTIPEPLFYSHLNDSGCNRTQTLVWTHYNTTEETEVYPGVIFDWHNCSDWTGAFFGTGSAYVLHWNGTSLIDAETQLPVNDEQDATDYYQWGWGWLNGQDYYEVHPEYLTGSWIKTIYNADCGRLYAKIWGDPWTALGLEYEPAGWLINETFPALASSDGTCYGLAYWNPSMQTFRGHFNYFEHWQLNYSTNKSSSWDLSDKRPHMSFPVIDMMNSEIKDSAYQWFSQTTSNLTDIEMRDLLLYVTNQYNMESRFYHPDSISPNDQNDTVYYYSALLTNYTTWYDEYIGEEVENQTLAHNCLMIWMQDCTDGDESLGLDEGFVAINVDDDDTWDTNDRAWLWDIDWDGDTGTGWQWNGSSFSNWTIYASAWNTTNNSLRNMHRYNNHINYLILIPLDELKNETGATLNISDNFGLCIATYNMDDSNSCYWQNWNETACDTFCTEEHDDAKNFFLNHTYLEDGPLNINSTNLGRWGQGEIENGTLASYAPQNCCLDVDITVWNGTAWVTRYNATKGETVTFNISVHNCGNEQNNMTIRVNHYDSIKSYITDSGRVKFPDEAPITMNPNMTTWEGGSCPYNPHGHMQWNISKSLLTNFTYCNYVYLEFNMSINSTNYSWINTDVALCEYLFDYWDSNCTNSSNNIYLNELFNTNISCTCLEPEASEWAISEYVHRPCTERECLDEEWFEYETNYTVWRPYNTSWDFSGKYDWEWVYRYTSESNETDDLGLSYTIANNSCVNRSLSVLRGRYNVTTEEVGILPDYHPHIGIIYAYENDSNYDMALYSYHRVLLISKQGDSLYDTSTGMLIENTTDSYENITNFYNESWICSYGVNQLNPAMQSLAFTSGGYGIWMKTIYNALCGSINIKAWNITSDHPFGLQYEPSGWIAENTYENISYDTAKCFGLAVWNPQKFLTGTGYSFYADFDYIDLWRLNYSRDENATTSQLENHTVYGSDGIPLQYFKVYDYYSDYWEMNDDFYYNCYEEWEEGNLTGQEYADCASCVFRNISSLYGMESRMVNPPFVNCSNELEWDNQNDTIYYYTGVETNISGEVPYNNSLVIQIEDCLTGSNNEDDGVLVAIDVDNDLEWDDNDMCFLWYGTPGAMNTYVKIWNGTTLFANDSMMLFDEDAIFYIYYERNATYWSVGPGYWSALPALHRYDYHRIYNCYLPLYYFEKGSVGSGNYLNANDTFGLHIQTIHTDWDDEGTPSIAIPWENWNESNCSSYNDEHTSYNIWDTYMNVSNIAELNALWYNSEWNGVDSTHISNWAHGRIGDEYGELEESFWQSSTTKVANISTVPYSDVDKLVNFTITVCNDGENPLVNVTVNDTLPTDVVYVSSSLPEANVTNPSGNYYIFNVTHYLDTSDCFSFNVTVNFTAHIYPNGTVVNNWANTTTDRNANSSDNCSVQYGENSAPQINWTYPVDNDNSADLLLANISAGIYDPDGDTMDVYFFTNKTIYWTNQWYPIGSNISVGNGVYHCNQTFNLSSRYNTKWRWGNTQYWCSINVTDGNVWTNYTFNFTTNKSRYDIDFNGNVFVGDLSEDWANRELPYLGLYDADANGNIFVGDLSEIWAHRR